MNTTQAIQEHYKKEFNTQHRDNLIIHTPSHTILEITETHITIITPHPTTWTTLIRTNFHKEYPNDPTSHMNQKSILKHLKRNNPLTVLELLDPNCFPTIDNQLKRNK